jgi:outer membrane protein TolC
MDLNFRNTGQRNVIPSVLSSPSVKLVTLLLIMLIVMLPLSVQAQSSSPAEPSSPVEPLRLTPDEAVSLAIKNNLGLESSRVTTSTKKRASDLSWNQFIPGITVAGSLVRDNEKTEATAIDLSVFGLAGKFPISPEQPQWHIAGTIQASLNISVAMFENMKRLRLDYEGGLLSFEKARAQLERDVRKSYYNMLLLQENIALLRESFENAGRRVQMAQANYNAGLAPQLTLLQAQVAQENMRPTIDQAENGFKLSMAQFAMNLGLPVDTDFELVPLGEDSFFIDLDLANMISKAASGKPDIQELRRNILILQSGRKAQIFSLLPTLSLSWSAASAFVKDPWKDPWFESGDDWRKSGSLTISLGLRLHSLLPFSQDFQAIKNLDDQIKTANIGLAQMIQGTEIEIYNTVLSLAKIQTTAQAQEETVKLAEQSYRLTEEAYRAGLQYQLEVQNAELSLRQARVQMLEQQFNYLNGLIDLEYSIGVPFGTLSKRSNH